MLSLDDLCSHVDRSDVTTSMSDPILLFTQRRKDYIAVDTRASLSLSLLLLTDLLVLVLLL